MGALIRSQLALSFFHVLSKMSGDKDSQVIYQEATKELHSNKEVRYMLHLVQVDVEYVHVGICVVKCVFKHYT